MISIARIGCTSTATNGSIKISSCIIGGFLFFHRFFELASLTTLNSNPGILQTPVPCYHLHHDRIRTSPESSISIIGGRKECNIIPIRINCRIDSTIEGTFVC